MRKEFWKIYFWIFLIVTLYSAYHYFSIGSPVGFEPKILSKTILVVLRYVFIFIPVLAIYGLGYRKKVIHHIFWKIYSVPYIFVVIGNIVHVEAAGYSISVLAPFEIIALFGVLIYAFGQNRLFATRKQ